MGEVAVGVPVYMHTPEKPHGGNRQHIHGQCAPARHRGMLMGVLQCGYPLGWFLAALLAAPLLETRGWREVFFIGFAVVPIALILGLRLPES